MSKKVYNVTYLDYDGEVIDQTQIDERSLDLARHLFVEFGHDINDLDEVLFDTVDDED